MTASAYSRSRGLDETSAFRNRALMCSICIGPSLWVYWQLWECSNRLLVRTWYRKGTSSANWCARSCERKVYIESAVWNGSLWLACCSDPISPYDISHSQGLVYGRVDAISVVAPNVTPFSPTPIVYKHQKHNASPSTIVQPFSLLLLNISIASPSYPHFQLHSCEPTLASDDFECFPGHRLRSALVVILLLCLQRRTFCNQNSL